jgi:hypothetical protein
VEQVVLTKHLDISDVLDECLDRMAKGESIESCAGRYPERRAELVPLLKTAAMTVNAASAVSYDPAAKQRGLRRLREAADRKSAARSGAFSWLRWKSALAVGLSAAVLMTATAWGTTMASSESVPGDTLYWVKRTKESISLMIPQSDMSRAEKHVGLAVERGEEMGKLVIRGRYSDAERHVLQVEYHISMTAGTVGIQGPTSPMEMPVPVIDVKIIDRRSVTHLQARISRDRERLYVGLMQIREELPPDARHQLDMLRLRSELEFRTILATLNGQGSPIWGPIWIAEPVWVVETAPRR